MGSRASVNAADWVDVSYASKRTGFSAVAILRLIAEGDMPAMQVRARKRTTHRLPRRLVDEAHAAVMTGGQVELREFARQWSARNKISAAVAS
jgi:hypothetical protein